MLGTLRDDDSDHGAQLPLPRAEGGLRCRGKDHRRAESPATPLLAPRNMSKKEMSPNPEVPPGPGVETIGKVTRASWSMGMYFDAANG